MKHLFKSRSVQEAERARQIRVAKAIIALEDTEGWGHFKAIAEDLIASFTPDVSSFSPEQATFIASQMTFISGIKRCLGLIEHQKDILASLKGQED